MLKSYILKFLIVSGIDLIFGIVYTGISMIVSLMLCEMAVGRLTYVLLIKDKGKISNDVKSLELRVLLSAGFIGMALKLATLYGLFIYVGGTVVFFRGIVLAFVFLFERKSGDLIVAF